MPVDSKHALIKGKQGRSSRWLDKQGAFLNVTLGYVDLCTFGNVTVSRF